MSHLVVDGLNVIGTCPDGWWRDRDGAARRLLARLQRFAAGSGGNPVTLVLDGRPLPDVPEGMHDGVQVLYARRAGRDAGDDRIVELLRTLDDPGECVVVTSDRGLADRAKALGARVTGARTFLDSLS